MRDSKGLKIWRRINTFAQYLFKPGKKQILGSQYFSI